MPLNLSARERDCARLADQGKTNKEIALALGIGERTVESYFESAKRKTGSETIAALVGWCYRNGVIAPTVIIPS